MKNWNKIGQIIATGAGAALLASFATLATPKTASAAVLSFNESEGWVSDNPGAEVTEIKNLLIGEKRYDVTFEDIFSNFIVMVNDYNVGVNSLDIQSALLDINKNTDEELQWNLISLAAVTDEGQNHPAPIFTTLFTNENQVSQPGAIIAMFDEDSEVKNVVKLTEVSVSASTPEPSLIFGFITLGGLMLGSKRKNKG